MVSQSTPKVITQSVLLCIWHWISKNTGKTGERVLKQATVWISFIQISN